MASKLPMSPIANHIINTLKAVHDQTVDDNVKYVQGIEKKLEGRGDISCVVFINQLDAIEIGILANRMKVEALALTQAARTLRCFY